MERNTRQLSRGYAAVFATVAIWSLPSLFLFYLNRFYDPWSQNFYRYAVACLAIVPFVLFQFLRGSRIDIRAVGLCLIPCVPNVVHQITQVVALFYMGPGVYAIFARTSVIFTALLALAFFPEERHVIRQWQFQLGTLLGLLGAFGVALAQTLQLLCPLGALALSAWIFHERLSSAQLISAAILLIGAFLAMRTKPIATAETAENL